MQQPVIEEGSAFEPNPKSYDDLFPALPESSQPRQATTPQWGSNINNKMRVGSSVITQVFRVPYEERKLDGGSKFGEGESVQTCGSIMKDTGAHIEISHGKDQSLTFLVTGKQNEVLKARVKILSHFQTQAHKSIQIPKEHHKWILGKKGERLRDLEKQTATKISVPNMNDESDVITITGPKEGIEKAEHEIKVTSDQQSKKAQERLNIPKMFHPFIVGPFNEYLNQLIQETGARINVPPPSVMKDEIFIAGEKEGVAAAKSKIEATYKLMEKKCTTVSVEVPKSQHKYVIGPKGATIAEILQKTDVSVEMPPSDSNVGTITLRGPHDKLGLALSVVYEKANSVRSSDVMAPSWLHKYIIGKKGQKIKEITQNLPKVVHVEFTDKDKIRIEGPPDEMEKAHEQIEAIAQDLMRNMCFVEMQVDNRLFKHIIGKAGANVNKLKDDFNVIINIDESGLIRVEGTKDDVAKTKYELEQRIFKLENEKERDVIIDQRHYRSIIGSKGESIKEIRNKFNQVQIVFPGPGERNDIVKVRGPKEDVDKCVRFLEKEVKELNEASHQIQVPIFKQFHKFIIGKAGANIRKIREETNTKIDLPAECDKSNCITITGKRENVEEAREKIQNIQDDLANIISEEITIDPKFYNSLIGAKGKLIHSIMEDCGGVVIKFPSTDSKSDKVTIRGPKEDVDRAKQQLLDLANERQLASYTAEVRAKAQHHKFLIGKNGANIKKIRDSTGARIIFPSNIDDDREIITILGKKDAVEDAKKQLEAMIKDIDNIVEDELRVEPRHHKHFVARRGEVLYRISEDCGGVMISFPRSGVDSDRVVLKGSKECIEAAKQKINEIIGELESMITIECIIPQKHHRTVMGAKGYRVQGVTSHFDVQIKFPDRDNTEEYQPQLTNGDVTVEPIRQCDVIRITGKEENCLKAKQALIDLIPVTIEVDVPFEMHRSIIGAKGQAVRDLMDRFDVHIVLSSTEVQEDIIKITGTPTNVEDAKEALQARVKELEADKKDRELRSFTLQIEVNPDYHPKIIGKRGAVITKIRKDHDVQITFPKKGEENEQLITISGYEENAYKAKEDILRIVRELDDLVRVEINIDSRVHSRLIGGRGRTIRKIMDDFRVDIKFPRNDDPNPDLVIISGQEDNVGEAREHLLNLAEEYLQDVEELETREKLHTLNFHFENKPSGAGPNHHRGRDHNNPNGFVVQGGPWEQSAPNTASVTDFPAFGRSSEQPQAAPVAGAWGNRR
ncbi:vigilin [Euwallacea fornicatus]|uniref:vigilin n=1 Tax=Euwallacea fornicatus TaxID=995702 RepID=UPI00338E17AB